MKKIMYSLFAVALSATVIYSCEKTEGKLSEGQEVTVHLNMDKATRAVFEDATGLQWAAGDQIFWKATGGTSNCEYTLTAGDITGGYEASFKTVIPGLSDADVTGWFKYNTHPNLDNNEAVFSDLNSKPKKYGTPNQSGTTLTYHQEAAGVANPAIIALQSSGSSSSITPETIAQGTSEITVDMKILGTVFRVLPYTSLYNDEVIQKVTFSSTSTIAGTVEYQPAGTYRAPFWANINKIIIELDSSMGLTSVTDKESSAGIYFSLPPTGSAIEGYEYVVTTDKAEYVFDSDKALTVTNNVVKNIPLNLDKATRVTASDWPVDAYFYPTSKSKFKDMDAYISSYTVAADKKSATAVMSDHLHHGGALYFDGGFNDILENKVYVESFDTGLAGFGNAAGFVYNFDIYENTTGAERTMDVVFYAFAESNNAKGYFTLHIVQPKASVFSVASSTLNVDASATNATINLSADVEWTAAVTSGTATLSTSSGNSNAAIVVSFSENLDTENANHYEVTISSPGKSDIVVKINQAVAGGGVATPHFTYDVEKVVGSHPDGQLLGFAASSAPGVYLRIKNVQESGVDIDYSDTAVIAQVFAQVFSIEDGDNWAGYDTYSYVENAIYPKVVNANSTTKTIELGFYGETPRTRATISWYDDAGTLLSWYRVFIN